MKNVENIWREKLSDYKKKNKWKLKELLNNKKKPSQNLLNKEMMFLPRHLKHKTKLNKKLIKTKRRTGSQRSFSP